MRRIFLYLGFSTATPGIIGGIAQNVRLTSLMRSAYPTLGEVPSLGGMKAR